jgi:hypothetical protein
VLALALFSISLGQAHGGLITDSVQVDFICCANKDVVLLSLGTDPISAGGASFGFFQYVYAVFDNSITLTNFDSTTDPFSPDAPYEGWRLTNITGFPAITGVTIDPATTIVGFDASRIEFDATHVWMNVTGLSAPPGLDVKLNLQFAPEPASWALMGLGLAGLVFLRRHLPS